MTSQIKRRQTTCSRRQNTPAVAVIFFLLLLLNMPAPATAEAPPVRHAASLSLDRQANRTIVTITNAWEGARRLKYLLLEREARAPAAGESNEYDGVIRVPIGRIASLATPALAHLADLNALDRVVAVDDGDYVYNRRIRRRLEAGDISEVGSGSSFNLERLLTVKPELVILSVIGPDDPTVTRLESVGIPVLPLADWREQSPLGRAEWIKLFGELLEKEDEAERIFEPRVSRYRELETRIAAEVGTSRPTVLTNAPWQGSWPVPGGESYVARLLEAAGGDYLWAGRGGTGSMFLDLETVLKRAADADVWINLNYGWKSRADALDTDPRLAAFNAFQTNKMYHYNRRIRASGANDFWESGATRPDLVLSDLIRILHPELLPDHELIYYKRLAP